MSKSKPNREDRQWAKDAEDCIPEASGIRADCRKARQERLYEMCAFARERILETSSRKHGSCKIKFDNPWGLSELIKVLRKKGYNVTFGEGREMVNVDDDEITVSWY